MLDQDYSRFSDEDLEQMTLGEAGIYKFDLYNELYNRYTKKNDVDMAVYAMERLIATFDGEIDTGTLVNARYKQSLLYFNANNFSFAITYAEKGIDDWEASTPSDSYFYLEWSKCAIVQLRSRIALGYFREIPDRAESLLEILETFKFQNFIPLVHLIIAEAYFHLELDDLCEEYLKLAQAGSPYDSINQKKIDYLRNEMSAGNQP